MKVPIIFWNLFYSLLVYRRSVTLYCPVSTVFTLSHRPVQREANVDCKKGFWNVKTEKWVFKYKGFVILAIDLTKVPNFLDLTYYRSSRPEVFCKKGVLKNLAKFTWKHLCQILRIFKNTFSYRTPPVAAFGINFWLGLFLNSWNVECLIQV